EGTNSTKKITGAAPAEEEGGGGGGQLGVEAAAVDCNLSDSVNASACQTVTCEAAMEVFEE
ncbi:GL18187, partial [Drosophila persimilis]